MAEKRCLYEVLNLPKTCSQDEIRSAYKKLALQLHPDKLIQTGIPENEATAGFQELINAYEVLSDPRERSWYDSHREQILYSTPSNSDFNSTLNLFSFFFNSVFSGYSDSGKGFFKVYGDVFKKLYDQEISFATKLGFDKSVVKEAPLMGNLESGYNQVSAFYNYWLGFVSVMDFTWVDQYHASAGPNRKSRRVMEEENKKLRKKARREYNEMVRGLAEFVKKRDKRVIERQLQKNLEQKEKQEKETARRKEEERVKLENARLYEEADWARVEEDVLDDLEEEEDRKKDGKELYCVVCGKKFKSDKQWKNHEQSKKHKERVAELRDSFVEEEEIVRNQVGCDDESKLCDEFEDAVDCGSESKHDVDDGGDFLSSFSDDNDGESTVVSEDGDNGSDEEMAIFEAMIKGHRTRKNVVVDVPDSSSSKAYDAVPDSSSGKADDANADETIFEKSEVSSHRRRRRNREPKKENGAKCDVNGGVGIEDVKADSNGTHERRSSSCDNVDPSKVSSVDGKPCKQETGVVDVGGLLQKKNQKPLNQPVDKKAPGQNEGNSKRKNSSKGKKGKASSKLFDHSCETCDESFDSRNKLFMHLSSTGHAMLKSR